MRIAASSIDRRGIRGLGNSYAGCTPLGWIIDVPSNTRMTAAMCPGGVYADPNTVMPICTGDPSTSDPAPYCGGSNDQTSVPQSHPPGPWNPAINYAVGDQVWDTCGKLYEYVGGSSTGPQWSDLQDVMIGAHDPGQPGSNPIVPANVVPSVQGACVGPMGKTAPLPSNWLTAAQASQPGGLPFYMTQAGQAQFAASAAGPSSGAPSAGSVTPGSAVSPGLPLGVGPNAAVVPVGGTPGAGASATPGACFSLFPNETCWGPVGQTTLIVGLAAAFGIFLLMSRGR